MRRFIQWSCRAALAAVVVFGASLQAAEKVETRETFTFGTLSVLNEKAARRQATQWLKKVGKYDAQKMNKIWNQKDVSVLDRLAATFEMGDATAAKLLGEARVATSAPTTTPKVFDDTTKSEFFRANLALSYAKALSNRKIYEQSHEALAKFKPEQVADPATFLFHKAVAEHAMLKKTEAISSIARLIDDVPNSPERYKMVATLMFFDLSQWKDKDLEAISRKMKNIGRRLDLARGGKKTQKMQKEVVLRLDEIIKELENQQNNSSGVGGNGGNCPGGGEGQDGNPGSNIQASSPQKDSKGGNGSGPGLVTKKKFDELAKEWGKLPPKEQAKRTKELLKGYPPEYRKILEDFFRRQHNKQ